MRGLSILIFSESTYPKHPGGAGKCAHLYAAALARRGHAVRIVCPGNVPQKEEIDGVEVHRVPLQGQPPRAGSRIEENSTASGLLGYVLSAIPLDSIDAMVDIGGFLSYFYLVEYELRKRFAIPFVVFFQLIQDHVSRDPERFTDIGSQRPDALFPDQHKERSQCFVVRIADAVICLSQDEADVVERLYHPARLHILGNPIDPALLAVTPDSGFRKQLAPDACHLLLFAGRMEDHVKGRDIVKRAFRKAAAQRRDLRLVLMGNTGDGYFRSLGAKAIDLGWVRDTAKLANVFDAVDLLLMPSRYEPFGMLCAEAMAMGVPAIASPVGGLREIVNHAEDGILLTGATASKWAAEMADWILRLTAEASDRQRLASNAKRSAAARFGSDPLAARLEEICIEAIETRAAKRFRPIEPPRLDRASQQSYRQALGANAEAIVAGELLLPRFFKDSETRCLACSRWGISKAAWQVGAVTKRSLANRFRLRRAIFAACPMSLVQLHELEQMANASGLVSPWAMRWSKAASFVRGLIFGVVCAIARRRETALGGRS